MLFGFKPEWKGIKEKRAGLKPEELLLHAGPHGMKAGGNQLEGVPQWWKPGKHFLQPGKVGLEGEEQVLKGKAFPWKESGLGLEESPCHLPAASPGLFPATFLPPNGTIPSGRKEGLAPQMPPQDEQ